MIFPPMRPQVEIQHVHDLLMDVLTDEELIDELDVREMVSPLRLVTDCLCWVLHHDVASHPDSHASHFADMVHWLREDLAEMGHTWEPGAGGYIIEED